MLQAKADEKVEFSSLPLSCLLVDKEGLITAANILAQEHLNVSERKLLGKNLTNFLSPLKDIKRLLEHVSSAETVSSDIVYTLKGHKPYSLYLGEQSDGFISVMMIAEGNRLEAEMLNRRHEMAEAVSRIALERAHEIKNPLASLRGAAQFLSEQVSGDQLEIATHMLAEIDRIKERVDGFLQVGPRANVEMEPVNIHLLIDDVIHPVEGVKTHRAYDPSIPMMVLHERRVRQAIENLWLNAIEAGSTSITWETRIEHGVVLANHKGMVVSIKIISDGNEIPQHIREKMFEPYVSGKARGNGLGLSIVQQVVQEHGGKIMVDSRLSRTTFTMYLPLRAEA